MISSDDINKLCDLSRIGATDEEKQALAKDLDGIIAYVDQIQQVQVPDDVAPIALVTNVQRPDDHAYAPRTFTEALLAQAPGRDGDYVQVKKVL